MNSETAPVPLVTTVALTTVPQLIGPRFVSTPVTRPAERVIPVIVLQRTKAASAAA